MGELFDVPKKPPRDVALLLSKVRLWTCAKKDRSRGATDRGWCGVPVSFFEVSEPKEEVFLSLRVSKDLEVCRE